MSFLQWSAVIGASLLPFLSGTMLLLDTIEQTTPKTPGEIFKMFWGFFTVIFGTVLMFSLAMAQMHKTTPQPQPVYQQVVVPQDTLYRKLPG